MINTSYKTILAPTEIIYIEKKSKFITNIIPITTEEQSYLALKSVRKNYKDAGHHCFAFKIKTSQTPLVKISDDGEPSGTAGLPILEVITHTNLSNVIIIVTRYFGGTLLGTGGLIKAYTNSAKLSIENSIIVENRLYTEIIVTVSYQISGKLEHECKINNYFINNINYNENVTFNLFIEPRLLAATYKHINNISNGTAIILVGTDQFLSLN